MKLNSDQSDVLAEVVNIGVGRAAASLFYTSQIDLGFWRGLNNHVTMAKQGGFAEPVKGVTLCYLYGRRKKWQRRNLMTSD